MNALAAAKHDAKSLMKCRRALFATGKALTLNRSVTTLRERRILRPLYRYAPGRNLRISSALPNAFLTHTGSQSLEKSDQGTLVQIAQPSFLAKIISAEIMTTINDEIAAFANC